MVILFQIKQVHVFPLPHPRRHFNLLATIICSFFSFFSFLCFVWLLIFWFPILPLFLLLFLQPSCSLAIVTVVLEPIRFIWFSVREGDGGEMVGVPPAT
ncbi:hypothetical protein ES332_A10G242000v1 [Gossypium tomentosum]|uniref:Transmembrane protein n=1 Tax=Gossypium tomentosum TaxID=34277 RepID=A0A5D2NU66_GOSTO|nr:hypothetical protein ES332_A10G242000v1 [Gossypium tomentosum]TYI07657.1 hypothetical protein ES332_A10G242000v1 [Gossypium tomentosum]